MSAGAVPESIALVEYTAYDKETGQVCAWGTDPNPSAFASDRVGVVLDAQFTGGWIDADGSTHHVVPERPSQHHVWDWGTKAWMDPRTLADLKSAKWAEVKAAREAAIKAPLVTPYGTFDADADARANITDTILLLQTMEAMGQPGEVDFTLEDNSVLTVTTAQMVMVGLLLGQQVQGAYNTGRVLRGAIDAATTAEEVEAIAWPA